MTIAMPGGELFGEGHHTDPDLEAFRQKMHETHSVSAPSETQFLNDPVFLESFLKLDKPEEYVRETIKYLRGDTSANPDFVLVYRRTVPKQEEPYPEKYWGLDFIQIRNGLGNEISGEQRERSVIYVSTLGLLERKTGAKPQIGGLVDGEIQIGDEPVDLPNASLFSFKPSNDSQ
jgi:hypothetical protein